MKIITRIISRLRRAETWKSHNWFYSKCEAIRHLEFNSKVTKENAKNYGAKMKDMFGMIFRGRRESSHQFLHGGVK